jgi:hypothetical protein
VVVLLLVVVTAALLLLLERVRDPRVCCSRLAEQPAAGGQQ